jgi:hypothetical protein
MIKIFRLHLFLAALFFLSNCHKDTSPITTIETPDWLLSYIEEIEDDPSYYGAIIYLYSWKEKYYYDVHVGFRSCSVCEVYNQSGEKIVWDNKSALDYSNNRKEIKVVWEWKRNN